MGIVKVLGAANFEGAAGNGYVSSDQQMAALHQGVKRGLDMQERELFIANAFFSLGVQGTYSSRQENVLLSSAYRQ